jgi:acetyl-CoA carboxylase biotin carboxyl carrier protein
MSEHRKSDDVEMLIAEFVASGARELHVRSDDFELYLSNDRDSPGIDGGRPSAPVEIGAGSPRRVDSVRPSPSKPEPGVTAAVAGVDLADLPEGAVVVRAPYMGTFYRAPKPGAPAYVELGSEVTADTELCLVEVMKLFTAVRSPVAGRVHAILATDGQMVEANQPIFAVLPA